MVLHKYKHLTDNVDYLKILNEFVSVKEQFGCTYINVYTYSYICSV